MLSIVTDITVSCFAIEKIFLEKYCFEAWLPKHLAKPHPLQFFLNVILKFFFSPTGSWREQGEPLPQEKHSQTAGPSGVERGTADPWGWQGEGHGPTPALL